MGCLGEVRVHVWRSSSRAKARDEILRGIPEWSVSLAYGLSQVLTLTDSPLKRFAQRFTYHGIDQIALRDLGFGLRSRQPPPPVQSLPPRPISPAKRPAPDSPRDRRSSIDRDRERSRSPGPGYKRYRQASPPPPRRYPLPERERDRGPRYNNGPPPRDRSPLPIPLPPMPRRDDRGPMPTPPPVMPPPPAVVSQYDRSGVAKPLAWFISTLPPARAFDGKLLCYMVENDLALADIARPNLPS